MHSWTTRQRMAALAAILVGLVGASRALLPFSVRTGVHVYERVNCSPPVVRVAQGRYGGSDTGNGLPPLVGGRIDWRVAAPCWAPAVGRVEGGAIIIVLAVVGGFAAVRLLRELPREHDAVSS